MKLHLGCGKRNFGDSWIHIDQADFDHIKYKDVTKLPYRNNTVEIIYCSHLIAYFDREEIIPVLNEWKRVLREDGILRIATPDFYTLIELYHDRDISLSGVLGPLYGKMGCNGDKIYHKTVYDFTSLKLLLEEIGFRNVKRYNWKETEHAQFDDHSQAYIPHMNKEEGVLISLNIECTK